MDTTVDPVVLSPVQQQALAELRSRLELDAEVEDRTLLPYLFAKKFDVNKAFNVHRQHAVLSDELGLSSLRILNVENELRDGLIIAPGVHDHNGAEILFVRMRLITTEVFDKVKLLKTLFYLMKHSYSTSNKALQNGFTIVTDMGEMDSNRMQESRREVAQWLLDNLEDRFPARVRHVFLVNASYAIRVLYTLMTPFLGDKLREKFFFLGKMEHLKDHFPEETLLSSFGGDVDFDIEKFVDHQLDIEARRLKREADRLLLASQPKARDLAAAERRAKEANTETAAEAQAQTAEAEAQAAAEREAKELAEREAKELAEREAKELAEREAQEVAEREEVEREAQEAAADAEQKATAAQEAAAIAEKEQNEADEAKAEAQAAANAARDAEATAKAAKEAEASAADGEEASAAAAATAEAESNAAAAKETEAVTAAIAEKEANEATAATNDADEAAAAAAEAERVAEERKKAKNQKKYAKKKLQKQRKSQAKLDLEGNGDAPSEVTAA